MKIWYMSGGGIKRSIEMAIFDFGESNILIWDYTNDEGEYNFRAATYEYRASKIQSKDLEDITDVFWKNVSDDDEVWLQQKLIKTVFE